LRLCLLAGAILLLISGSQLLCDDAFARVGGGQSYGGGGSSGGGSYSGGGDDAGLLYLLVWLVIRHPYLGIPLLIAFVIFKIVVGGKKGRERVQVAASQRRGPPSAAPSGLRVATAARQVDANFSEPAFLDFAQVLYARVHQERPGEGLSALAPFLSDEARAALGQRSQGVESVRDVIFGATRLVAARRQGSWLVLDVRFETNLTEVKAGKPTQLLVTEVWKLRKSADVLSPPPERLVALACPSCGNPAETRANGTCVHCDTPIASGRALWNVSSIRVIQQEPVTPPPLRLGGAEPGEDLPTVFDPQLPSALRAFLTRHPEFDLGAFLKHVGHVFVTLQEAWSTQTWEKARVHETDPLFQSHRYWMERYRRFGLRNHLEEIELLEIVPVRVETDAFYEAVTVRIRARMKDYTKDSSGKLVAGDDTRARRFSEYWTFIRTAGQSTASTHPEDRCPSCGAPLDRMGETGVCGYCEAKVSTGRHDWVLSAIEQSEAYVG
jgi:predicted lipid-binding transport protein (Tim44 family)